MPGYDAKCRIWLRKERSPWNTGGQGTSEYLEGEVGKVGCSSIVVEAKASLTWQSNKSDEQKDSVGFAGSIDKSVMRKGESGCRSTEK